MYLRSFFTWNNHIEWIRSNFVCETVNIYIDWKIVCCKRCKCDPERNRKIPSWVIKTWLYRISLYQSELVLVIIGRISLLKFFLRKLNFWDPFMHNFSEPHFDFTNPGLVRSKILNLNHLSTGMEHFWINLLYQFGTKVFHLHSQNSFVVKAF